ncbi:unnamed protein product [Dibothriocephalus latus]|uniref:Uncharacterized protein n=1 Tax=Dibothriocephalus latus TaxID=60516 RepID=A0A3P7QBN9_DIBLA|nr:unnamed protein product [Dibothriocephalus latus]
MTAEMMEKEKAQLREEIARLNALADSLRPVCANYQNTFEEALDLKCRSCMAFDSAATQAREELAATCSEAETVHKALEDSNRRFLKIKETIEERQKVLAPELTTFSTRALEALDVEKQAAEREVNRLRVRAKQLDLKATSLEEEVQRVVRRLCGRHFLPFYYFLWGSLETE